MEVCYGEYRESVSRTALLIAPFSYRYSSPTVLINEHDGVRIISTERCDFLQKVPRMCLDCFILSQAVDYPPRGFRECLQTWFHIPGCNITRCF